MLRIVYIAINTLKNSLIFCPNLRGGGFCQSGQNPNFFHIFLLMFKMFSKHCLPYIKPDHYNNRHNTRHEAKYVGELEIIIIIMILMMTTHLVARLEETPGENKNDWNWKAEKQLDTHLDFDHHLDKGNLQDNHHNNDYSHKDHCHKCH